LTTDSSQDCNLALQVSNSLLVKREPKDVAFVDDENHVVLAVAGDDPCRGNFDISGNCANLIYKRRYIKITRRLHYLSRPDPASVIARLSRSYASRIEANWS